MQAASTVRMSKLVWYRNVMRGSRYTRYAGKLDVVVLRSRQVEPKDAEACFVTTTFTTRSLFLLPCNQMLTISYLSLSSQIEVFRHFGTDSIDLLELFLCIK